MPAAVAFQSLSKTFRVKVRDLGLAGAVRALFRPGYREVQAVWELGFEIAPGESVAFSRSQRRW